MKKLIFFLTALFFIIQNSFCNGVVVVDTLGNKFLKLQSTSIEVTVENQVAVTKTTQVFVNNFSDSLKMHYAFPLPENASAMSLKFVQNGITYKAKFSAQPQNSKPGNSGSNWSYIFTSYLGNTPLHYNIDKFIQKDSVIVIELEYVELLSYKLGFVKYYYPNDYSLIQPEVLNSISFKFNLKSERTIESINLKDINTAVLNNSGKIASIQYTAAEKKATFNFTSVYSLSQKELGLSGLSTYLPDSVLTDSLGRGFFTFVVEPDASDNTSVINKVFTLIIDQSGSMSGTKIEQARNAAKFIVEHLNTGDKFNIISFSDDVYSFKSEHVDFNTINKSAAINYINSLESLGSTNISGAFSTAIPQFKTATSNTANIIIFFTDGEQTSGITDTEELIKHIDNLTLKSEAGINLFTFGIGSSTNERLLNTIAADNSGAAEFLAELNLESVITDFYLMIQNPVLLKTQIAFAPQNLTETYPVVLPNLYKGQQMLMVGRYNNHSMVNINMTGKAFNKNVSYTYDVQLSDSFNSHLNFLPKLWAKKKIEWLMANYYQSGLDTAVSNTLKKEVISISLSYGVLSPFTSFSGSEVDGGGKNNGTATEMRQIKNKSSNNKYIEILSYYPVPVTDFLLINYKIKQLNGSVATLKLINSMGVVIGNYSVNISGIGDFDYKLMITDKYSNGVYFFIFEYAGESIRGSFVVNK